MRCNMQRQTHHFNFQVQSSHQAFYTSSGRPAVHLGPNYLRSPLPLEAAPDVSVVASLSFPEGHDQVKRLKITTTCSIHLLNYADI